MTEDVKLCRSVNYPVTSGNEHSRSNVCRATNDSFILRSGRPLVNFDCFSSRELMPRRNSTLKATEKSILDARAQAVLAAVIKEHLHTSAGRVPTDQGYRYYVDHILEKTRLSRADLRAIDKVFTSSGVDSATSSDRIMEKMSHALSELSTNVGIVVSPSLAEVPHDLEK